MIECPSSPVWSSDEESIIKVYVANILYIDRFPYVLMAEQSIYRKERDAAAVLLQPDMNQWSAILPCFGKTPYVAADSTKFRQLNQTISGQVGQLDIVFF